MGNAREEYDGFLQALVGRRIKRVDYYAVAQSDVTPASERFDSLDFGLTLFLENDSCFSFTWGEEFSAYGVSVDLDVLDFGSVSRTWDGTAKWVHLIDAPITSVSVLWLEANEGGAYPQEVRLVFANDQRVTIAASEKREEWFHNTDHITVIFEALRERDGMNNTAAK